MDEQIENYVNEAVKDKSRAGTINRILDLQNELGIEKKNSDVNAQAVNDSQVNSQPIVNENVTVPPKVNEPLNSKTENSLPDAGVAENNINSAQAHINKNYVMRKWGTFKKSAVTQVFRNL